MDQRAKALRPFLRPSSRTSADAGGHRQTETMKADARFLHVGRRSKRTANISLVREKERKPR
jgi:hypothetical protein